MGVNPNRQGPPAAQVDFHLEALVVAEVEQTHAWPAGLCGLPGDGKDHHGEPPKWRGYPGLPRIPQLPAGTSFLPIVGPIAESRRAAATKIDKSRHPKLQPPL